MGVIEILYRIRLFVQSRLERCGVGLARAGKPDGMSGQAWCIAFPARFDAELYRTAADRILRGQFDVFALHDSELGFPPSWNNDPKTGKTVPLVFGKTLDYRNEEIVGDIKYVWEPNRHLALVTLAQAWRLSGEPRYLKGCQTLLDSWFEQCPYPMGVNWVSSLELSIRLLNWSFAWHLLGGDKSPLFAGDSGARFKDRWLRSVFQHCHFIAGYFSRYSSANNHLLGEYMGLLVGALTWPLWPQSAGWKNTAERGFETEALRQTAADGVNREQAVYYQHEVMDMMLLCGLVFRANGSEFGSVFWDRLEAMMTFVASVMDCAGNMPMIGDADDALMVHLSQERAWSPYRSLLATGAVLFSRGDLAAKAGRFDDKSRWLLGDVAAKAFAALHRPHSEKPHDIFSEGGYYLMGARFGCDNEVRALIDCGPLGYLSIAAHGHADALSFVLSAGGHELLIDPGTYAYHTQKKWRNYFRGTFAHNTLRIDGLDQSVIGGNFLWSSKADAQCERAELVGAQQVFRGRHDGYMRLDDPLMHHREIRFDVASNRFEVIDDVRCTGRHAVELCWHFSEACMVTCADGVVTADAGPVRLLMSMEASNLIPDLLHGSDDPLAGWVSRSFDIKMPTTTLVWRGEITGNERFMTRMTLIFDHRPNQTEILKG